MPECPECGAFWLKGKCRCGWKPSEDGPRTKPCGVCDETYALWTQLTEAEGLRRCARCHMAYLERRFRDAGGEHGRCTEPGCTKTAAEHRAEFLALVTRVEAERNLRRVWAEPRRLSAITPAEQADHEAKKRKALEGVVVASPDDGGVPF